MATVPISDGDPKNSYTATAGQTTFAYTFWIKSSDHLAVYVNGTLKTLTTDYTVSAVQSVSGANVVFNSGLAEDDAVVIVYDPELERTAEYTGTIRLDALNTELTYLLTLLQSNKRQIDDSLRPPDTETGSFSGALPALSGNGLKVLRLKSDLSGVEFGPTTTGLDALAALTTEISALGAITSEIVAVEAVDAEIVTVAGLDTEIAALGPISANITTVAGNTTNINTVASDLAGSDTIGTVAGLATEVAALGAIATEIAAVEAVDAEIVTLAALSSQITALGAISTELTALGAITTEIVAVEAVDAEIAALAALTSELTTLGALSSEISALGAIATEIAAVEAVDAEIVTLAALDTEITALAALSTELTALGALTTEISAVAGITTEISAVYAALSTITDAASNIPKANRVATTDPTVTDDTSEGYSEGSQWVNTSTGAIFFLADATEGAAVWTSVAGSISGLSDTTISGVASGDILRYNGSVWTNQKYIDDMSAMGAFPAATTDYIPIYDTSATTEYKITPANFFKNIFGLTTDASPDAAADYVLTYDTSAASAKKILLNQVTNLADDSTPQLGGNLDVNGNSIVSASNGNIPITPNGTGKVILDGLNWPTADGSADQLLKTDGAGNLSFVDAAGGQQLALNNTETGQYYNVFPANSSGAAVVTGTIYYIPLIIPYDATLSGLVCRPSSASVGNVRLGLYSDNNGYPNSLLYTYGTASTNTTSFITIVNAQSVSAGLYWMALQADNAASFWQVNPLSNAGAGFLSVLMGNQNPLPLSTTSCGFTCSETGSYASGLPATASATKVSTNAHPAMSAYMNA